MSTDTLIDFLVSEGAEVADGVVVSFANEPAHDADAAGLKVPLRSYGVVAVTGDDAEAFLQGQFAGDCQALAVGASMLTAWCNPKGRVIVLVHLIRSDAGFHLLVEREQPCGFPAAAVDVRTARRCRHRGPLREPRRRPDRNC